MDSSNLDRQKAQFLELANRGRGLNPIDYTYSKDLSSDNIITKRISSAYGSIKELISSDIETDTIESTTSATIANIKIYDDTIRTVDNVTGDEADDSNLNIELGEGNGTITIQTYNFETTKLSTGNIDLITSGSGDINLTPTLSGPQGQEVIGIVNINTLQFSLNTTNNDNTITAPTDVVLTTQTGQGNISLSTFNLDSTGISTGDINLTTYGSGNINLMPTYSGPTGKEVIGSVNINELQFTLVTNPDGTFTSTVVAEDGDLSISTVADNSNFVIAAQGTDSNIFISTANSDANSGSITLTSYGGGDINLTPTAASADAQKTLGNVNINTLQFSVDPNANVNSITSIISGPVTNDYVIIDCPLNCNKNVDFYGEAFFYIPTETSRSSYVSFLPSSGITATYTWPDYPSVLGYTATYSLLYLTSDGEGNLSWVSKVILAENLVEYEMTNYLSCSTDGTLSWTASTVIPMSEPFEEDPAPQVIHTDPYLTSDSSGNLSWIKAVIIILPLPPIPPIIDGSIMVNNKTYAIPSLKGKI